MSDLNSTDLLLLAGWIETSIIDKMAHALGWPSVRAYAHRTCGKVKWAVPYRNYYAGSGEDSDWLRAEAQGLARLTQGPTSMFPDCCWVVTEKGKRVVRLRLDAVRYARELNHGK